MTIRYECEQCGSTLKIKDDLAGKPGKCPKCKFAFAIPELPDGSSEHVGPDDGSVDSESELAAFTKSSAASDDFDVDEFLMSDRELEAGTKPKKKKSAASPRTFGKDQSLADESHDHPKSATTKSASMPDDSEDEDVFQIRRSDTEASAKPKYTLPPGVAEGAETAVSASRRPPGTTSAGTASNIAGDLLSKSGKKGKKTWSDGETVEQDEEGFDWAGLGRYLGLKIAPMALGALAVIVLLGWTASSMFAGKSLVPELGKVTGIVRLNGEPLTGVQVEFHPIRSPRDKLDKSPKAGASMGMTDDSGKYELTYDKDHQGAAVGLCRVVVVGLGRKAVPKKYSDRESKFEKEVKPGRQEIPLELELD